MKVPVAWLREFADVPPMPSTVAARMAACGFAVDGIEGDVIDFDITANRPDCLSVYGLAREAATAFDVDLKAPELVATPDGGTAVRVSIGDPGCARYAMFVADVTVGPSPEWMAARLTAAGVRPINNVVDITNYVMLELGHPMHAFDVSKLARLGDSRPPGAAGREAHAPSTARTGRSTRRCWSSPTRRSRWRSPA